MEKQIEAVAKAIWDAKAEGEWGETPTWNQLSDSLDRALKDEMRLMAKAAIKACSESK